MKTHSNYRAFIYVTVSGGLIVAALFAYEFFYRYPIWNLRAFRVPSSSMCPSICSGERVFVEMLGQQEYVPKRGEVVAFKYGAESASLIKRVIGIPGDTVAPGPNDTILVNEQPWTPPTVCAKSPSPDGLPRDKSSYARFTQTKVPTGQIFVIGDNLYNSFDSRIPQFEPVTFDKVFGKPVLIYWSPEGTRIGCSIR